MSLKEYRKKRDFKKTAEPSGRQVKSKSSAPTFVIQKHDASRLHYDFRLEIDGVLKSWAVPKGPSFDPSKKSLAVQVEDHPLDYGTFEGTIPQGQYGGGTVMLWDRGTWEPLHDPAEGLASGKLHFALHGEKLHGEWTLVQMHGRFGDGGKNWLLFKVKDAYANTKTDITRQSPNSVSTGRTLEQIAAKKPAKALKPAKPKSKPTAAAKSAPKSKSAIPEKVSPQLATLVDRPPTGDQWLHEIKFDGYRIVAIKNAGHVKLITRNGNDYTHRFKAIAADLEKLTAKSAVIDGEVVVLDKNGKSNFQALQNVLKGKEKVVPVFYAFDLLHLNAEDLTSKTILDRKAALKTLLKPLSKTSHIHLSDYVIGNGDQMTEKACEMGLEGIVSKHIDSPYVGRRLPTWVKSKCDQRQEFVIIGFTQPQRSRQGLGALLLGYYEKGKLQYAGRVGTGFDTVLLKELRAQLTPLTLKQAPKELTIPYRERREATWVKPTLVCEVRFTGWTEDNILRHPAFIALRADKPASQVVREITKAVEEVAKPTPAKNDHSKSKSNPKQKSQSTPTSNITLTHPDKLLYPEAGVTKQHLADYYHLVAPWILPHVLHRPLALMRCPGGRAGKCFFQRNWSSSMPAAIRPTQVGENGKKETHVKIENLEGLLSLVQIGILEIHTWNCTADQVEKPDQLVFDLDPGPGITWKQIRQGAIILHRFLEKLKLPAFLKTSGGKGLHLTAPIKPNIGWDSAKSFTAQIAAELVKQNDLFVDNMRKDLRNGKIYIDYQRNGRGATAVAPYSTRAREGAPVSMPISWEELGKLNSANHLTVEKARKYLERRKTDPWKDFEQSRVDLHKIIR